MNFMHILNLKKILIILTIYYLNILNSKSQKKLANLLSEKLDELYDTHQSLKLITEPTDSPKYFGFHEAINQINNHFSLNLDKNTIEKKFLYADNCII